MKTLYSILLLMLISTLAFPQTPEAFNYQAVIRNASGDILTNSQIALQFSLLQDSESGSAVYVETFNPTTNDHGLIAVKLGKGTVQSGTFNSIGWGAHEFYIKIEVDPNNGTDFTAMGTTQLLSVPYALYAKSGGSDDADADPLNEIQNLSVSGSDLSISEGNTVSLPAPEDNSITSDMIINGEVNTDDIATDAVTSDKIDDGPGSGLDADLLDGEQGSYYRDASNINSGPLSNAYYSAYGDLMAEGYLDESSANDLVTLGQADSRYATPAVGFFAFNNAADAVSSTGWNIIECDYEVFDDGNDYSNTLDRFVAPVDGVYHFTATVTISPINEVGLVIVGFLIDGVNIKAKANYVSTTVSHQETMHGSITYRLNAGDVVQARVYSGNDASYNISGSIYNTWFSGHLVRAD